MKLSRVTTSGPSLTDEGQPTAPRAGSATTTAAAEALAAAAAAAAAATTAAAEADYAPSSGGGGGAGSQSRFLDARREKNRLAAKRCRDRKQAHLVALEAELTKQQNANDALSRHVVTLVGIYQRERKHKRAATALLQALAGALLISDVASSLAVSGTANGSAARPPPPPHTPLSKIPLLCGGTKTLSEVLGELEAGLVRTEDVEGYVRDLRSLRLQVVVPAVVEPFRQDTDLC
ncbi:hypothetical protein VOLCADRAFT_90675 [Volvox carteri f. nagariensis]|uniref:BZIP domain-containing protein n=1 Tax=Volvox carteri f. nagariensis TaxID=3068 RepID=D8TVF1_VOLCA|nr:uncharacterized protein VOLCADRAFT_90675 [Volvox carteri f. nagariensis]EFJ48566.1 hypothetical protein VOLCADRAFT_90675 [Volvox carteri f. nagariensis]|eukprot:XP_002950365.1 hypothetical protein VOLCADRAFT_90675 [Volvox carteri f. nagariensis]